MKNRLTLSYCRNLFAITLMLLLGNYTLQAQTANFQDVTKKCWTGPTQDFNNTTGILLPPVNFVAGVDIPLGHVVVDVIVEIVWSKTDDGSCTAITGNNALLQDVGFQISGPIGGSRYLAASAQTAFFVGTVATFSGSFPGASPGVIRDTIVFRDGYPSPIGVPNFPQRDTVSTNNQPLSFYMGASPYGNWTIGAVDDPPGFSSPRLCIHSYCITLVTCDNTTLNAACLPTPSVALNGVGTHLFQFADLNNGSDVSCITQSITFSPASVNCSNIGTPVPVTMTITDKLGNVDACVSNVNVIDNTKPVISSTCFPGVFGNLYLGPNGRDTFWADSVVITDNCGLVTKQVRPLSSSVYRNFIAFNCVTGFQQFWVRGTDAQGNRDSCRIIVNVIDTVAPTAVCGSTTVNVGNGPVTVTPISVDGGSTDICPPITGRWINVHLGPSPVYSCANLGIDTVSLIVGDASGNLDTCHTARITVIDNVPPVATCQTATVYLNAAGTGTLLPAAVNNGSTDVCGVSSMNVNGAASISYNCSHVGTPQNVTLNVFDASGNTAACPTTVTVLDTFPPTPVCQNRTIYVNGSGTATLLASALNSASTDVCTGTSLSFFINGSVSANFSCANIATNPNPVTLTVIDDYGNDATCPTNVTVLDTIRPVANCATPTVYLNGVGSATVTATQLNNNSTDNCAVNNLSVNVVGVSSTNYTCAAIFTPQPATLIVRDASGNQRSCATTVNVVDTVKPTALCKATFTANLNASGVAVVTPANIDNGSTDNCNIVLYRINGATSRTYTCSDIGTTTAILTVRDSSGNTSTCTSSITIVDNTPPTAACQVRDVYLSAGGTVSITPATVLVFPTTSDNCGTITTTFQGGGSNINYNCDSIGARTVRVVVRDASNNTATCQTTVTVHDTIAPTANCRPVPYTVSLNTSGVGFVVPANVNNASTDICGIADMFVNGLDTFFYNCSNIGNSAVTLSVLDGSGNLSTCVAQVQVTDPTPPVAVCHDTTLFIGVSGVVTAFPANINRNSSDNCGFTMAINNLPSVNYNCSQVGVNTAQLIITDGAGNTAQCPANITIRDTIRPTANCIVPATLNVYLNSTCFATVPASIFNNGSTDNCASTLTYRVGGLPNVTFTGSNLGLNNITLTVRDGSNNTSTCNTSVIVRDTIRPNMICRTDTVELDATGNTFIVPSNVNNGSTDNCGVPTYTVNNSSVVNYTCANLGVNNVTLRGTDASGNTASCNTTVLVRDIIAPNAICAGTATVNLSAVTSTGTLLVAQVDGGSTDNCSITSYVLSQTVFNCSHIAANPHTITMTVTDQSGNTDFCTTQVTVVDPVPPTASCQPTLNLVLAGTSVSTTASAVNNGSTDNCSIASMTLSQTTFTCANIGANNVVLTVTDGSGNVSTCAATVNVTDNTNPVALCNPVTVNLNATGTGSVAATALATGSFDACGISVMLGNGQPTVNFTCANLGSNAVTVYMEDPSGNSATCVSNVTVVDPVPPTANCIGAPYQLFLNAAGTAILGFGNIDAGSTDNCSVASFSLSKTNYNCSDIVNNPNNVTMTVTDVGGNNSTCVAQVVVRDTIRPAMVCQPRTVYLNASCNATISASIFNGGSTDACGIASYSFTGAPTFLTATNIGNNQPIILTGTDVNGNSATCNTTLTVRDTIDPVLTCNSITVSLNSSGAATVTSATPGLFTGSDACGAITVTLNGGASVNYTCANLGGNNITLVATDPSGNSSTCNSTVTIQDNIAPTANCVGSISLYLNAIGAGSITASNVNNLSTDNCTVASTSISQSNFNCSNVATSPNIVTLTVTDQSGNNSTCNTPVNVLDTVRPTMVCQPRTVFLSAAGTTTITATIFNGGSADACGMSGYTFTGAPSSLNCAHIGVHNIILRGTDVNGNFATCPTTLTVRDTVRPSLTCSPITINLNGSGAASISGATVGLYTMSDACGTPALTLNGGATVNYTCANIGNNNVTLVATDGSGNSSSCVSVVTVRDITPPTANCAVGPVVVYLNGTGTVTVAPATIGGASVDNCTITSMTLSQTNFDCSDISTNPNPVTLTVTDQSGNANTCNTTINAVDTVPPTMICKTDTAYLNLVGANTVTTSMFDNGSNDACGMASLVFSGIPSSVNCSHVGIHNITLTGTDIYGNAATCPAVLEVADTVAPVLNCNSITINLSAAGTATVTGTTPGLSSMSDACGGLNLTLNGGSSVNYTCANVGTNNITLVAVDTNGNSSSCVSVVTVRDVTAPTVICTSTTRYLPANGTILVNPAWITGSIVEACGVATITTNPSTLDCSDVGPLNTITLTVTDVNGNTSSCNGNIALLDTIKPNMVCRDTTVCLGGGFVNVDAADVDGGTTDACGMSLIQTINGSGNLVYTCSDIGVQLVVLERRDVNNNVDTCHAYVTVEDCVNPNLSCQPYTAYVAANGVVTVPAIALNGTSTFDDCAIDSTTFRVNGAPSVQYGCAHVGIPQNVSLTVRDFSGNADTCFTVITVADSIHPVARCKTVPINAVLSATTGQFVVQAFTLNSTGSPTSSDNCGIASYLINGQARDTFTCAMVGLQMAVLTVVDNSGNTDTCHTPVNVRDLTNPNATCQGSVSRVLGANGTVIIPASALIVTATDNCGIASILGNGQDTLTFNCSDIGNNIISVQVLDGAGNAFTCSSIVSISDNLAPIADCVDTVQAYLITNNVVVPATALDDNSTDNCGIVTWLINGTNSVTYNCTHIGVLQPATLTVRDSTGNQSTCPTVIQVLDTTAPTAICKVNHQVTLNAAGLAIINAQAINNGSFDNCGSNLAFLINNQLLDTFTCADVGSVNTALLSVTDQYGNTSYCTSTITVIDNTVPTVSCPPAPISVYLDATGQVTVDPQDIVVSASDVCGIFNWYIDGRLDTTFNCSHITSTHLVQIRVEDPSGNFAQCNAIINVRDTIPPTPGCQPVTVALDSNGTVTVCADALMLFNTDNCGIVDTFINFVGQNCVTYNCNDVPTSPHAVTLGMTDASGNTRTCATTITIIDNIAPVGVCRDTVPALLNSAGIAVVQAISLDNGSFDACGPLTYQINGMPRDTFDCTDVGNFPFAVLTVTDANGNQSTCFSRIDIQDELAPTAVCQDRDVYLNASGSAIVNTSMIDNGSLDNCYLGTMTFSTGSGTINYNCSDIGLHTVMLIVPDLYGNVDTCTADVTVRDTIKPNAFCNGVSVDLTNTGAVTLTTGPIPGPYNVGNATDACGIDTMFVTPGVITCTNIGRVAFTLTAIDNNGNIGTCVDTATVYLERPTITIPTQDTVLCEGGTLPLGAIIPFGSYTMSWTGPTGQVTYRPTTKDTVLTNIAAIDEGLYIFTVVPTTGTGCPARDTVYLDVNEVQPPVLAGAAPCDGDTTILYLTNTATYIGSTITYNWYFNGTPIAGNNFDSLVIANMNTLDSGTYSMAITVTQGPATCYDSSAVGFTIDILDLPAAPVPTANVPCEGQTLTLFNNAPGFTYNWSGPAGFSTTVADPTRTNSTQAYAGTYTLTITDGNNCSNSGSVSVTISTTPPQPNLIYTQPLCVGDLLELSDTSTYVSQPVFYYWQSPTGTIDTTSVNQLLVSNAPSGDYTLVVSMNGCLSIIPDTQTVVYEPIPSGADDFFSIQFRDSLVAANIVNNDNPNASGFILSVIDSTDGGRIRVNANGTIDYYPRSGFFGTDTLLYALCDPLCPNSCDTMEVLIEVVVDFECFIPQGISPNGDGVNDNMIVRCRHNYPNAVIQIFSRWGTLVYEGRPTGWDGKFNGADLPDGTYFYVLKLNDTTHVGTGSDASAGRVGDQYTGYIMLQR